MPHIFYRTATEVYVVCEYVPTDDGKGTDAAVLTDRVDQTICLPKCGLRWDSERQGLILRCFHPNSPYYTAFKKKNGKVR
jgi:hypothetical protein